MRCSPRRSRLRGRRRHRVRQRSRRRHRAAAGQGRLSPERRQRRRRRNAIRNIRNHLSVGPVGARSSSSRTPRGVQFLLDGAKDGNGNSVRSRGAGAQGQGRRFPRLPVSRSSATRSIRSKVHRGSHARAVRRCRSVAGCSSRKASPTCVPRPIAVEATVGRSPARYRSAHNSEEHEDACKARSDRRARGGIAVAADAASAQNTAATRSRSTAQALQDGNPAELWEARGEGLWKQARGPNKVSLEHCDLGLGPGVVKGAYAQLPRYFADADRVMDLESRLVHCMVTLQGFTPEDAQAQSVRSADRKADMEALVAYVTSESRGVKMNVPHAPSEGTRGLRARREDVLLPRRPARLRVRHLPRRGQPAHPPAGPAEPDQDRGRAARLHDLARVPRLAGRAAHRSSGGCTTASASSASRSSSSPRRRFGRAHDVPAKNATAARSTRRRSSAERRTTMKTTTRARRRRAAALATALAGCAR